MLLLYNVNFLFILRPTSFVKFKITVGELSSFYREDHRYEIYYFYNLTKGVFMGEPLSINKKRVKNITLFLGYNAFVYYYKNHDHYMNNVHIYRHFIKLMNYNTSDKNFIPEPNLVLLSNHGYNKMLDILFVFDILFSLGTKITHGRYVKDYQLDTFQPTFIFHGLLLLEHFERPQLVSIIHKHIIDHNLQVIRYDYSFSLERNTLINQILEKINANDKVSNIIKQYFLIYKQTISELINNSDVYTLKDKYELDNVPYSSIVSNEKHLLKKHTLCPYVNPLYYDAGIHVNNESYLSYYIIILFSKAITKIITPKELNHNIDLVKVSHVHLHSIYTDTITINSINIYTESMYFIDKKDVASFILVYDNQNRNKIKSIKNINTKEFLTKMLRKQLDDLPLYFPKFERDAECELENFYEDTYNWKYILYIKLKSPVEQKSIIYFNIGTLREVNIKLFGHKFNNLFVRYIISIQGHVVNKEMNIDIVSSQCIVFSETYLDELPQHYVNFFIEEDDIKQINEFTSNIMYKYYKDYDKYNHKLPVYTYGGEFNLKIIISKYLFNSNVHKKSLEAIEFYKNNLLYNAFTIIDYHVGLTKETIIIDDNYRSLEFMRAIEYHEKVENTTKITLLIQNDDYVSKGIYRFKPNSASGMYNLFISIAIPKNEFDGILEGIQNANTIEIEGVFSMNSIKYDLYLNGFVRKLHYE